VFLCDVLIHDHDKHYGTIKNKKKEKEKKERKRKKKERKKEKKEGMCYS